MDVNKNISLDGESIAIIRLFQGGETILTLGIASYLTANAVNSTELDVTKRALP